MQTGIYAGKRIKHEVTGHMATKPFRYHDLGSAAYLSRGNAVVSVGRLHLSGFLAWIIWLFIHIGFLTGFRNRLGALVSWWPAFIWDIRRQRIYTTEQVGLVHSTYDTLSPVSAGSGLPGSTTGAELPSAGAKPTPTAPETVTGVRPAAPSALRPRRPGSADRQASIAGAASCDEQVDALARQPESQQQGNHDDELVLVSVQPGPQRLDPGTRPMRRRSTTIRPDSWYQAASGSRQEGRLTGRRPARRCRCRPRLPHPRAAPR